MQGLPSDEPVEPGQVAEVGEDRDIALQALSFDDGDNLSASVRDRQRCIAAGLTRTRDECLIHEHHDSRVQPHAGSVVAGVLSPVAHPVDFESNVSFAHSRRTLGSEPSNCPKCEPRQPIPALLHQQRGHGFVRPIVGLLALPGHIGDVDTHLSNRRCRYEAMVSRSTASCSSMRHLIFGVCAVVFRKVPNAPLSRFISPFCSLCSGSVRSELKASGGSLPTFRPPNPKAASTSSDPSLVSPDF